MEELPEWIKINRAWEKDSRFPSPILGRNVPRKPRLEGGAKGYDMKGNYLSGKPRPVAGELQFNRD